MTNPIRTVTIKVEVDADTSGFARIDAAQEKTGTGSIALGGFIANMTTKLVEMGVAAAKAGAALISDLVFGTTEAADAVAKTSQQLGVQAEQLQRLSGAAQLSGASTANLDKGVRTLTKGLADASLRGTGPAADALATLGLTVEDLSGDIASGDIESVVGKIGDAFNETGDSIEKSAALMQLFGGAGTKLRPLLEEGSEGIEGLGDEIKNVISDEDLKKFEELADAQFLVDDTVKNLKNQLAAGLAPAITTVFERIDTFIDSNEELVTQDLPAFLATVGDALVDVADFTFETIDSWREFIREIDNAVERFEMDFPAAVGIGTDALALVGQVADDVGDKVSEVVDFILDAVSKLEALESTVASIKAGLGLDDEPQVERGAGATLPGGGPTIVPADRLTPDNSPENLQKIVDDTNASDTDRAAAAIALPLANLREFQDSLDAALPAADARADAAASDQEARDKRARRRAKTSRSRSRGGGGGGGKAAAAVPTVDMLIAAATGAAGGGPSKVGGNALAGTMLVNVDQSITINNGAVSLAVTVPQSIADSGDRADLGGFIRSELEAVMSQQHRVDLDRAQARLAVGGG